MNPLDRFFLELKQSVKINFCANLLCIEFSRQPSDDALAICQRLAASPGFQRVAHRSMGWDVDTMTWLFTIPSGIPRVPLAKALLESFQEFGIKGVAEFLAIGVAEDPTFPFEGSFKPISKTLEELSASE